jgi:hypothetical protein
VESRPPLVAVAVGAAHGFVDDLVHHAQGLEAMRGDAQGFGGLWALSEVFQRIEAQPSG